ncbi:hypothetical protein MIR68_006773 [Amoeboaphelidium protococcarum]|nr:hypothetical protein MIR68_006773 [Amoeboaphelidium protococcarum]
MSIVQLEEALESLQLTWQSPAQSAYNQRVIEEYSAKQWCDYICAQSSQNQHQLIQRACLFREYLMQNNGHHLQEFIDRGLRQIQASATVDLLIRFVHHALFQGPEDLQQKQLNKLRPKMKSLIVDLLDCIDSQSLPPSTIRSLLSCAGTLIQFAKCDYSIQVLLTRLLKLAQRLVQQPSVPFQILCPLLRCLQNIFSSGYRIGPNDSLLVHDIKHIISRALQSQSSQKEKQKNVYLSEQTSCAESKISQLSSTRLSPFDRFMIQSLKLVQAIARYNAAHIVLEWSDLFEQSSSPSVILFSVYSLLNCTDDLVVIDVQFASMDLLADICRYGRSVWKNAADSDKCLSFTSQSLYIYRIIKSIHELLLGFLLYKVFNAQVSGNEFSLLSNDQAQDNGNLAFEPLMFPVSRGRLTDQCKPGEIELEYGRRVVFALECLIGAISYSLFKQDFCGTITRVIKGLDITGIRDFIPLILRMLCTMINSQSSDEQRKKVMSELDGFLEIALKGASSIEGQPQIETDLYSSSLQFITEYLKVFYAIHSVICDNLCQNLIDILTQNLSVIANLSDTDALNLALFLKQCLETKVISFDNPLVMNFISQLYDALRGIVLCTILDILSLASATDIDKLDGRTFGFYAALLNSSFESDYSDGQNNESIILSGLGMLGVYAQFPSLITCQDDAEDYLKITSNLLSKRNLNIRAKASWALANVIEQAQKTDLYCLDHSTLLALIKQVLLMKEDVDKVTCHLCRVLRSCLVMLPLNILRRESNNILPQCIEFLLHQIASISSKTRWNACHSLSEVFSRQELISLLALRTIQRIVDSIFSCLQSCRNYKVWIYATSCLVHLRQSGDQILSLNRDRVQLLQTIADAGGKLMISDGDSRTSIVNEQGYQEKLHKNILNILP